MENIFTELTAKLKIDVTKYKESLVDKNVIFYVIEIVKRGNEKWTLEKRFSEFDHMNKNLLKLFPKSLVPLPPKTVFKLVKPEDLEQRRQDLDKYMKALVVRQDIFNSEPMRKFLNIENFAPEILITPPKLIKEITNFIYGVRDFHYQRDQNLLFALVSDMNVASRVDSYLSNMKMPWDREDKPPCVASVGVLECYVERKNEPFSFDKLWSRGFASQAICMVWDQPSNLIVVGLDDGYVFCGKVASELQYLKVDEMLFFKIHESRVMGVGIDPVNNIIYSAGEDKTLKVTNISDHKVIFDCVISHTALTNLYFDGENKRIIVTNKNGNVFVYDVTKPLPSVIQTHQTVSKNAIRGFHYDPLKNFVFTGSIDDGEICVFDIKKPGKEKLAKMEGTLKAKSEVRVLVWSNERGEIISGHIDGTVSIWSLKKEGPLYVIKDSEKAITKLKWFEKDRLLFTGSKEKNIKIWEFPEEWRDQKIEEEEEFDKMVRKKTSAMLEFQKQQEKIADDSDEDDISKIRF